MLWQHNSNIITCISKMHHGPLSHDPCFCQLILTTICTFNITCTLLLNIVLAKISNSWPHLLSPSYVTWGKLPMDHEVCSLFVGHHLYLKTYVVYQRQNTKILIAYKLCKLKILLCFIMFACSVVANHYLKVYRKKWHTRIYIFGSYGLVMHTTHEPFN